MKWAPWLLAVCLLLGSCGYQEGVVQRAEQSYLKFTGNWANASVQIDDRRPFTLTVPDPTQSQSPSPTTTLYQLSPGRHRLVVSREGRTVVDRVLILENHATMEVQIP